MRTRTPAAVSVAVVALLLALPTTAQTTHFDITFGHQWLDVSGNSDVHRSQTGQDQGLLLDGLSLVVADTDSSLFFDRLQLDAAGIGASPDQHFRLQLRRALQYAMTVSYRRAEVFSALPDLANPFLGQGIVPGEHTLDRTRELFDFQLELLPGRTLTPFVGYSRQTYRGPARTTYHVGEDEFRLSSDLDEKVDEYRVGLGFTAGTFHGSVTQGWRKLDSVTYFNLVPGAEGGNNSRPVLGHDVALSTFGRTTNVDGTSPFTTAVVSGRVAGRVRLVGTYARTDLESDTSEREELTGQLVSFELRRFFGGLDETVAGRAKSPVWRGELRAEVAVVSWLDLIASYGRSHRELSGTALITSEYLDTTTYTGVDPRDLEVLTDARTVFERDEDTAQLKLLARPVPWLRVWVAGSRITQDVTVTPAAAEIVIPGGQGGSFDRDIDRTSAGAVATFGPVELHADWRRDDAGATVVRTDYLDRDWLRLRGAVKIAPVVRILATYETIDSKNPTSQVDYTQDVTRRAVDLELMTPSDALALVVGYSTYDNDTKVLVRLPQNFSVVESPYLEDGESIDGRLRLAVGRFNAEVGGSEFTNEGTFPLKLRRAFARAEVTISKAVSTIAQYERRKYKETERHLGDYEADRYGLFVRYHR